MKRFLAMSIFLVMLVSLFGCADTWGSATEEIYTSAPFGGATHEPAQTGASELPSDSSFSVQFIDVGQADAALVECDGRYMLIDGGNKNDASRIYSILKQRAVPILDMVVGTHAHEDHIGGIPGAFQYTTAKLVLCPVTSYDSKAFRDFSKSVEEKGGGIRVPKAGDTYLLGSAVITILGLNSGSDTNDTSIVLRIEYGDTSFLFMADAELDTEMALVGGDAELRATVLKVGHHGSDTSTGYIFLRESMPQYAVISCGKDNPYGHPAKTVLSRLRDADVQVFRTDLQGDVICTSDGQKVSIRVSKNPDGDTLGEAGKLAMKPAA